MSIFTNYPKIVYPLLKDGISVPYNIVDIMTRVQISMTDQEFLLATDQLVLNSGDTPESVSYALYGTPNYHWTILYVNAIHDYLEWFRTDDQLDQYCIDKYGAGYKNNVFWVDDYGIVIASADSLLINFQADDAIYSGVPYEGNVTLTSYYDLEVKRNEQKRYIRVIKQSKIVEFINRFNSELKKVIS